jgi:hypothetical protein
MSASGQMRRFRDVRGMSGLPPTADLSGHGRHFAFVPQAEVPRFLRRGATPLRVASNIGESATPDRFRKANADAKLSPVPSFVWQSAQTALLRCLEFGSRQVSHADALTSAVSVMGRDMDQNGPSAGIERSGRARLVPARSGFTPVESAITTTNLTVDHIGEADRFAYWREQWCQSTAGVTGELAPGERNGFYARARMWTAPCVIRMRLETGPFRVSRGMPEISRHSLENWICLYQELSDGSAFEHAGKELPRARATCCSAIRRSHPPAGLAACTTIAVGCCPVPGSNRTCRPGEGHSPCSSPGHTALRAGAGLSACPEQCYR